MKIKLAVPHKSSIAVGGYFAIADLKGYFRDVGLEATPVFTRGGAETMQVLLSGDVDIALGVGLAAAMAAFMKGAPVVTVSIQGTGATSTSWYVPGNSPIKSWKRELTGKKVAYSRPGSRTNMAVLDMIDYYKQQGWTPLPEAVSVGGPVDSLAATLTGQVDVGWNAYPTMWDKYQDGTIREIMHPTEDLPGWKDLIVGVNVAHTKTVEQNPELIKRFNQVWKRAADFTYTNTKESFVILSSFAKAPMTGDYAISQFEKYSPKWAQYQGIAGTLDKAMEAAVSGKFIERPLTKAELDKFFRLEYIAK
jgi:ABC-type nitrate/sulfonate/bicarbonate transport system substrate-binding protein